MSQLLCYNPDRMSIPRPHVTEVMKAFMDFSMIPDEILTLASERGRRVHAICAAIAREYWVAQVSEEDRGYVDSFQRWMDSAVERVHLVEEEMEHPDWHYTGRLDLVVTIRGDTAHTLVDLKTPRTKARTWAAQLAAYRRLVDTNYPTLSIHRSFSLRLNPEGKAPIVDEYTDDIRDFNGFLSALQAYRYFMM